ncbi:uncharacterized protein [Haliotis cracherodii]|uniref:uncharacterized protein n=1 Tax=Haliotis cracherodii TaxID=6455 RepID=UPI0039E7F93D
MAVFEKDSNPRLDENLTHRPVGRVDIRSLYQRRPPCMQIERSLEDIEATVLHGGLDTIKTFPTDFPAGEAYVNLKTRLNELSTMENNGLAYIAKSLPATANMDIKYRAPGDVILDICLIRQGSPAVVLSVVTDMPVDMKLAQRYTSAVSKELTKNVRRFTTVTFNSIYGLLHEKDLESKESFESCLSRIEKERSRLCVPDSLSMNREKYKHVVRAFLSSVAVTTFVNSESEETLWFLTRKQFCILTQNIDHTEVHVDTCPASGGGVLSLTVVQRLQKLGRTLLISDDPTLVERARKQNIDSKTFNDIKQSDLMADLMNIVMYRVGGPCSSQTPQLPQLLSGAHRRWVFHRQKGMLADEDGQQRQSLLPEPATVSDYDAYTMDRIHNLLDASSAEIAMAIKDSFRTSAVDDVIKLLEGDNRWVTITGLPGEGKTTLGYMVLETMKAKGATVCVIDNPDDYALFTDNAATMHVFLFKDVLRYATCDLEIRKQWIHFINNLHRKIVKGEDVSNVYAVFICNKYDEEWKYFGGYDEEIFHRNVFNLSDHFRETHSEQTTVLKYFLQKYQTPVHRLDTSIACTKHGFLHCCKLFCEWQKTNQTKQSLLFFSDPLFYVMNIVSAHIHDVSTMTFLRNMLQNDRFISTKEVVLPKPLSQMPGVFLQEDKEMLTFSHPSVRMAVALVVGKEDPLFVLQNCNSTFVIPRLKIHTAKEDTGFLYVNLDNPEVLQKVISTFKHALQEGFFDVIGHEMCLVETFCRKLLTDVSNASSTFLNEVNMDGYSLLHVALRHGNKVAVRVLLDMEVNVKAKCHGKTVLHILCEDIKFDKHLFLLLLDNGADVSAVDEEGQTILHHLCMMSGNDPAIPLVLGKGCDTTGTDKSGKTALHYLCANRHIDEDFVTRLIQSGCDVNMFDKWGKNALHYLCESSVFDQKLFHIIVKHCADVSATDHFGNMALHYAAERTHPLYTIDFLIKNGSNINWKTKSGDTVPLLLCKLNKLQSRLLDYLIGHGADLNVADVDGKTILIILAENGTLNLEMLRLLISAGCDVNKQDDLGNTPLHYCCIRGNMDKTIFRMLRYYGTNVNHQNQFLKTPLHYACEHKYIYPQVIKHLIIYGADTNATDLHEMTPLIYLCENTRTSMDDFSLSLDMLLQGKCDLNKSDKDRKTALHYVCERQKNTKIICELIRKCEEVNMSDSHGSTPLHYLCMREDLKDLSGMVNMLTQKDSDPNICDEWRRAPLHLLCNRKHIDKDIIRILLTAGANVNVSDVFKKTPLHYACDHTTVNRDAITLLIRGRADVNISDGNERTPLHLLCRQKHIDIEAVKILLKHNALVNNTDEHGNTVLHDVSQNEASTKDIVTLIIEHGADLDKTNGLGISVSECLLKRTDLKPIVQRAIWKHMPAGSTMQAAEDYNLRFQLPNGAQELFKEIGRTGIIDRKDKHGKTFLHYACAMKYDSIIEQILKLNCNINLKDPDHMTALHIICKRTDGNIQKFIALLLAHGAKVDITDRYGNTPLHYLGMTTINAEQNATHLELLLNRGADVTRADGNGIHLVHYLAIAGICDKIKVALDKETRDVDVTIKHDVSTVIHKGQTALHLACISSEAGTGVVRELLKFKANICATDRRGRTPLHYLCLSPCKIAYNAKTNELTVEPTTDRKGRKELVELLLAHHMKKKRKQREQRLVDEDSTSDSGLGELSDCPKTTKSASVPVPPAVKDYVNMTDDRGRSAFQYLCSSGTIDNELFQYMISLDPTVKAALVNNRDYNGLTVLHSLVLSGSHLTEKIIGDIKHINLTPFDGTKDAFFVISPGQTALHLACRTINADLKIVHLLLQHKAEVNVIDCNDRTPLYYICEDAQNISWDQTSHELVIKSDSKPPEALQDIRYNIALALIEVGAWKDKPSDDGVPALHGQFRTMFSST